MHIASLGSSFASGPSIPPQLPPPAARRSASNYPSLLSRALSATLTDLSASGATLLNVLAEPQQTLHGALPPQLAGLPARADVVTITAGGNDLGYSAGMMGEAAGLVLGDEAGLLEALGLRGGVAAVVGEEEAVERFVRVIEAVKVRAPRARVFLVEYLAVFGAETRVAEDQPLGGEAVERYRALAGVLGRVYRRAAERGGEGVEVVGIAGMSEGHAVGSREPWVVGFTEGLLMGGGAPYHPNAEGHKAVAREVEGRVRKALEL